jgi:hypothetical protein
MMKNYIPLNVALVFDDKTSSELIKISKEISHRTGSIFTLGSRSCPHMTLYMGEYPEENVLLLLREIGGISKDKGVFNLIYKDLALDLTNYLWVVFQDDSYIRSIHKEVVYRVNPLRDGKVRSKYEKSEIKNRLTKDQLSLIKKYGTYQVLDYYHPHLTITKFHTKTRFKDNKRDYGLPLKKLKYRVEAIVVCVIGNNGTCKEIIKRFQLK